MSRTRQLTRRGVQQLELVEATYNEEKRFMGRSTENVKYKINQVAPKKQNLLMQSDEQLEEVPIEASNDRLSCSMSSSRKDFMSSQMLINQGTAASQQLHTDHSYLTTNVQTGEGGGAYSKSKGSKAR